MPLERLQKIIAAAGIASRRKAEELITGGLVSVNGKIVTELGTKADVTTDRIKVGGKALQGPERHVYLLLHKPKGYVTTVTDPEKRPTVMDLVRVVGARLYPVGRLDYLSEGLLLLTNDGELAQKLTHASSHVPKTYLVKISGKPTEDEITKLRGGVFLPAETKPLKTREGTEQRRRSQAVRTGPVQIELLRDAANPWYEITLIEGRNRQIRRMFEQIDHHVEKIKRVRYGPLQLDVEVGQFRHLTGSEVAQLKAATKASNSGRKPQAVAAQLTASGGRDKEGGRASKKAESRQSAPRQKKAEWGTRQARPLNELPPRQKKAEWGTRQARPLNELPPRQKKAEWGTRQARPLNELPPRQKKAEWGTRQARPLNELPPRQKKAEWGTRQARPLNESAPRQKKAEWGTRQARPLNELPPRQKKAEWGTRKSVVSGQSSVVSRSREPAKGRRSGAPGKRKRHG